MRYVIKEDSRITTKLIKDSYQANRFEPTQIVKKTDCLALCEAELQQLCNEGVCWGCLMQCCVDDEAIHFWFIEINFSSLVSLVQTGFA